LDPSIQEVDPACKARQITPFCCPFVLKEFFEVFQRTILSRGEAMVLSIIFVIREVKFSRRTLLYLRVLVITIERLSGLA